MKKWKLATWNVNSIRSCQKKGLIEWIKANKFDVICLQETRALEEQLDDELLKIKGYNFYLAPAEKKGYSGVGVYISNKKEVIKVEIGIGINKFDSEGRTIIIHFKDLVIINGYFPNGQRDHNRVPFKLEYSREIEKLAREFKKKKEVIICGDINTAHKENDLANPKGNKRSTGFLLNEREWIDQLVSKDFNDLYRVKYPDELGSFTWWSNRNNCRERNIGWRIDYFFATKKITEGIISIENQQNILGSDHCPISLTIKF